MQLKEFLKVPEKDEPTQLGFIKDEEIPCFEEIGSESQNIYFIISGKVYLVDPTGLYVYGILQDGSYFGDISALLKRSNEFNYMYDPYYHKPVLLLKIDRQKFYELLEKYPGAKEILEERAKKRLEIFRNYKIISMMRYMKYICANPNFITAINTPDIHQLKLQTI